MDVLGLGIQLCKRAKQLFFGLLDEFSGAAAAYSLRKLSKTYNGPIVEVRRDGDLAERSFNSTVQIEDWVNGKLETTLPCDVATSAAAYSLRKVRSAYAGDAVRIRRASDDVEVNVAFDANGEVSTSSAIANVTESPDAGDTTATTLGGFISGNENNLVDFSSGSDDFFSHDDQTTIQFSTYGTNIGKQAYNHLTDTDSIGASPSSTSDYSFRFDSRVTSGYSAGHGITLGSREDKYAFSITFKYYVPEGEPGLTTVYGSADAPMTVKGAWTEVTISSQVGQGHRSILLRSGAYSTTGGLWYMADLRMNLSAFDTNVQTWYDQSGNGYDATQDTAGNQPKIAEAGALITNDNGKPAILGDATDDILNLSSEVDFGTNDFFVSTVLDAGDGAVIGSPSPNWLLLLSTSSIQVRSTNTNTIYIITPNTNFTAGESYLISLSRVGDNLTAFVDGVAQTDVEVVASTDTFGVDRFLQRGTNGNPYDEPVSEVILYASDQSANRFKIESNINNHYGIYTPAEDGFVHTWYDQSGNGNDAEQNSQAAQPKIVSSGSLVTDSRGNPAIDFDNINDRMNLTSDLVAGGAYSAIAYHELNADSSILKGVVNAPRIRVKVGAYEISSFSPQVNVSFTVPSSQGLVSVLKDSSNNARVFANGIESSSGQQNIGDGANPFTMLGTEVSNGPADGKLVEVIYYESDQSANRTGIESNIADEYGITLP